MKAPHVAGRARLLGTVVPNAADAEARPPSPWLLARLRCWCHGHTMELRWAPDRLWLRCVECGRETPGWALDVPRPVRRYFKLLRFRKRLKA